MNACVSKLNDVNESNEQNVNKDILTAKFIGTDLNYKHQYVWRNVLAFVLVHILGLWGIFLIVSFNITWKTFVWFLLVVYFGAEGITVGAHRLFSHKSFKAKLLLRIILTAAHTSAGQNSLFTWVRDHRLHHRYSDTDADPHNAKRGFFFSHMGWLMAKKHPYVIEFGKNIDISDLKADKVVMFQKRYYLILYIILAIIIPVCVPIYFFDENWKYSLLSCYFGKYILQLNGTWLVNSAAHIYGPRPYDRKIQPAESWFVSLVTLGEGWHNYHHVFPWDYKCAELSMHFNFSARLIRFLEKIGLAYDLKTASPTMVTNRIFRTGDGTHYKLNNDINGSAVEILEPERASK